MTITSFEDFYHTELQDAYSACKQSLEITVEMGRHATDPELSQALIDGANGISDGMDRLASLSADHGIDPNGHVCKGMAGLVREARDHTLKQDFASDALRDAMIIAQYQRLVHYAIAAYGCLEAYANRLGHDQDGAVLADMQASNYSGDRRLTEIATKHGGVNAAAA